MRVFLDASVIILGLEKTNSNSALVLDALLENEFEAVINEKVILEVKRYFKNRKGRQTAYLVETLLRKYATVIHEDQFKHLIDMSRKEIKAKDVEHLATTRAMDIRILVAFDRDFIAVPEYMTPKEFIETLGKPPSGISY